MSEDIVKRLRIKSGVMEMGEQIAWGSDTALMREAAHVIEALRKNNQAVPDLLEALEATLECLNENGFGKAYAQDLARAAIAKAKGDQG